mgnify:CR=1 FL=1
MTITATPIHNGHEYAGYGFTVRVTSDERFFTIRDSYGEPCGTITRPRVMGGNRNWESHMPTGAACTTTAVGPRSAFRSFLMAYRGI